MVRFGVILTVVLLTSCGTKIDIPVTTEGAKLDISGQKVALMWLAPDCPLCQLYSTSFCELAASSTKDISFYGVLPGNHYGEEEIRHFKDSFAFNLDIIADKDYGLSKKLSATITPEFFLLDSGYQVLYSGKFDDWATDLSQKKLKPSAHYFKDAIQAFSNGTKIEIDHVDPVGCTIEYD